ncbi:MAG: sugar transferase, partial [Lachnospiraceae bacterium]|nr:sugar transferase [Lachnospiraceae bacterium]
DKRLEKDVEYVEHISFLLDLRILWRTVMVVFAKNDEVAEVTDDVEGNLAEIRAAKNEDVLRPKNTRT